MWSISVISIIFCFIGYGTCDPPRPLWNQTWTDLLKKDLFITYDKYARPSNHYNVTRVNVSLTLTHVDIDERKSTFNVNSWFRMSWFDEKLQWDPVNYGNLTVLHLGNHEVWQPDVVLYNSASDIEHYGNTHVLVTSSGTVLWVPPSQFDTFCEIDLTHWPYDTQRCTLLMGSWTYDGYKLDLWPMENAIDSELQIKSNEWQIKNTTWARNVKMYDCCTEPYVNVEFNITVQRRPNVYRSVVTVPAITVIVMTLSTFMLPINSGQKILLNAGNIISVVLFLLYFTSRLGNMAISTPLIVLFYSNTLYLVSLSMLISVLVLNIAHKKNNRRPLPWILKKSLDGQLGKFLWIERSLPKTNQQRDQELRDQPFDEHATSDDDHMIQLSTTNSSIQEDWINLAKAIDRISLICYCAIFTISGLSYII